MSTETTGVKENESQAVEPERTRGGSLVYRPNVDILESSDELVLLADMPGVERDTIDVNYEDGELSIHGRAASRVPAGATPLLAEYGVGDFYRTFRVSEHVDAARISAEYAGGVLTVRLPKVETVKPRKIAVNSR